MSDEKRITKKTRRMMKTRIVSNNKEKKNGDIARTVMLAEVKKIVRRMITFRTVIRKLGRKR